MNETLKNSVAEQKEAFIHSLQESIRIRSVREPAQPNHPYGAGVQRCLEHALQTAASLGLKTGNMDNQVGWAEYGEGEEMIAILGHLDVVPEGEGWTVEPYGGDLRDGKVFGRGAMDDKGPVFASLYALAALKASGLPIQKRIRLLLGTNEETGSNDMKYYIAHGGELPVMGFTPDGEYPVINGEKGIVNATFQTHYAQSGGLQLMEIRGGDAPNVVPSSAYAEFSCEPEVREQMRVELGLVEPEENASGSSDVRQNEKMLKLVPMENGCRLEALGVNAHGSTPENGENAIGRLLLAMAKLPLGEELAGIVDFLAGSLGMETNGEALGIGMRDEVSGGLTLNLGTIEGDAKSLKLQINYRYPVTKSYEACAPRLKSKFIEAGFQLTDELHKPSLYVSADSKLVETLLEVYTEATGLPGEPKSIGGGTYAKAMPNLVAFGPIFPGDEIREHKPDEYMEVEKLMKNAEIFAEAIYRLAR